MPKLQSLRSRLRIRQRFRSAESLKHEEELAWWLNEWDPVIRAGGYNPGDALELLGEDAVDDYQGRRWQQARAEVVRILREAEISDPSFFDGKVVLDIGSGPLGFPEACPARVSIGVDPLADAYRESGLLLESNAIHLAIGAESIPLIAGSVDVVVARNSLDHVDNPRAVVGEAIRLLAPEGTLILTFDLDHTPTATEPHALDLDTVLSWLAPLEVVSQRAYGYAMGHDGHAVTIVAAVPPA